MKESTRGSAGEKEFSPLNALLLLGGAIAVAALGASLLIGGSQKTPTDSNHTAPQEMTPTSTP